jgi:Ca2+-transporting ATPase
MGAFVLLDMILAIHTKVQGRGRYRIEGLYRSDRLKRFLEIRLLKEKEITGASASKVTSNILVTFNSAISHDEIADRIETILRESPEPNPEPGPDPCQNPSGQVSRSEKEQGSRLISSTFTGKLKDKIIDILPGVKRQEERQWHLLDKDQILQLLDTQVESGLSVTHAKRRLERYGFNTLPEARSRSGWSIFADQFLSIPVALLTAAAGLSVFTGGIFDAVMVMGVVVANAAIGYMTEVKAERTIRSLKSFISPDASVIRNYRVEVIPAEKMVIGDMFLLKPGTYVAADSRVIEASHLSVDESALTGESMPAVKQSRPLKREDVPLSDRSNMVYMGTLITGGEGIAVVVATGRFSEMGRLKALLDETETPLTPIEKQLRHAGDQLVLLCGVICGFVFLLGFLRGFGVLEMLKTAVSLAAAAVPEGLPAAATINFAMGVSNMKKHHVLIRHLQAIETLGAVQTVCLDKTGTITRNRMTVMKIVTNTQCVFSENGRFVSDNIPIEPIEHADLIQIAHAAALCNETKINGDSDENGVELSGSPTENALIRFALKAGVDVRGLRNDYGLLKINYRSENRLFMSTLHRSPEGGRLLVIKGSPREVLSMCRWQFGNNGKTPLTDEDKLRIEAENDLMAGDTLRILGLACNKGGDRLQIEDEEDLTWLGLIGMADPIRAGVDELIKIIHNAGINTVMITGDQSQTAYAVANSLNLSHGEQLEILDSALLTRVDPELMKALAKKVHVYSRVSPAHKLKIVQALQEAGKVVAMTGDGINDGPALKASNIGIAMGKSGTDVAREVADVVLEDDNLETLVMAIRDGRATYNNIRKSVHFFLSTNLSEIMVMVAGIALGFGIPLSVMQLLWINIISDIFPGLALSLEEPEPDILRQQPREADRPLFSASDFKRMVYESATITAASLGAYAYGAARYGQGMAAGSLAFQSLTIGQLLHTLNCRSETLGIFDQKALPRNRYLELALGGSFLLQMLTIIVPGLRRLLGISPVNLLDAGIIGGGAFLSLVANSSIKKQ